MAYEKYITLESGREIKLIIEGSFNPKKSGLVTDMEVLIKDPKEEHFHPPIEISHPKYWKLKNMLPEQSKQLQIKYSGIPDKQIRKALREFEKALATFA